MGHPYLVIYPKKAGRELLEKDEVQKEKKVSGDTGTVRDTPPTKTVQGVQRKTSNRRGEPAEDTIGDLENPSRGVRTKRPREITEENSERVEDSIDDRKSESVRGSQQTSAVESGMGE